MKKAIGIDIGGTKISVVIGDASGKIHAQFGVIEFIQNGSRSELRINAIQARLALSGLVHRTLHASA